MSFVVIASKRFSRLIKRLQRKYYSIPEDFAALITALKANPTTGNALGRGCYKVRIDSKKTGKSGSARVITCVKIVGEKIYLLTIYDKSEQDSISDQERDNLKKMASSKSKKARCNCSGPFRCEIKSVLTPPRLPCGRALR